MQRVGRWRIVILIAFLLLVGSPPTQAQKRVEKLSEIKWEQGTLVYYKGEVPLDQDGLQQLNKALLSYGMPVTVVIAEKVSDERWTLPDGTKLKGHEAAEFAVGHGLFNQGAFAAQVDTVGVKNGSAILLAFEPDPESGRRPFKFYSSQMLNSAGLSWERAWSDRIEDVGISLLEEGRFSQAILTCVKQYTELYENEIVRREAERQHNIARAEKERQEAIAKQKAWDSFMATLPWIIVCLVLLVVVVVLFVLNRRAKAVRAQAKKTLDTWLAALAGKQDLLAKQNEKKGLVLGRKRSDVLVSGKTQELANSIISKIGRARILIVLASDTVEKARALIGTGDSAGLSTGRYERALEILKSQLEFDPHSGARGAITGIEEKDDEYLWAPLSSFQPVVTTFDELVDTFNQLTKEASAELDSFLKTRNSVIDQVKVFGFRLTTIAADLTAIGSLANEDEQKLLSVIGNETIPTLQKEAQSLGAKALKDPIGLTADTDLFKRRIEEATLCLGALRSLLEARPDLSREFDGLEKSGIKLDWLRALAANLVRNLIATVDSMDSNRPDISGQARENVGEISSIVSRVKEINTQRAALAANRDRLALVLKTKRSELETALGLSADALFSESDDEGDLRSPDKALADCERELAKVRQALNVGKLEEAQGLLGLAKASSDDAESDIRVTITSFETQETRAKAIAAKAVELGPAIEKRRGLMAELKVFAPEALHFLSGDPTHPRADGSVSNNIEEIDKAERDREASLEAATIAFKAGKLLEASDHLTDAENWNVFIGHRLEEISSKHASVTNVHQENGKLIPGYLAAFTAELGTPFDNWVRQETIDLLKEAQSRIKAAKVQHSGELPNPFEIVELVAFARNVVETFGQAKARDRSEYQEAEESIRRSRKLIEDLTNLVEEMRDDEDHIPDADSLDLAERSLVGLQKVQVELEASLENPHADWFALDEKADQFASQVSEHLLSVKKERKDGEAAQVVLSRATSTVREARNWSGSYGVSISSSAGQKELSLAKESFDAGEFEEAKSFAEKAERLARKAIDQAEAEVERERRAERERKERERQEREEEEEESYSSTYSRRSPTFSSPFKIGGGGIGGGGFGGGGRSGGGGGGFGGGFRSGGGGGGFSGGFKSGGGGKGW